ncbi:MAG: protein kinase, partial [Myxococcales bacterium]|nr:protein kinase [Myxococcales bacterium]
GRTLSSILSIKARGRLPVARAVDIAMQVCAGLHAAHREAVVHRDLKPGNILMERSGRVVITDFGVACMMSAGNLVTGDPMTMVGTPAYMAPEQLGPGDLGAHTDIYALGLVLYQMLTGDLPFREESPMATAMARLHRDPPDPATLVDLPPELSTLVLRCLRRKPEDRPASAMVLAEQLAPFKKVVAAEPSPPRGLVRERPIIPQHLAVSSSFVSIRMSSQSLAVLPLRYRGPESDAYLAEAITEELTDLLSMTRGLKVLSTAATARYGEQRDPRAIREQLGVGAIVDGSVQRHGDDLRVVARLIDTDTGIQVWSERFDGRLEDVMELQDAVANRIAESLRLELDVHRHTTDVPVAAVELYLRARQQTKHFDLGGLGPEGAEALLRQCLELAPNFAPAVATQALVLARLWYIHGDGEGGADWPGKCHRAVERALAVAPTQPETHLAAGRMHCEHGDYRAAAQALRESLHLAPTYAAAHAYLGALQCEAGRAQEGYRHLTMAVELEPTDSLSMMSAASYHAQRGDYEQAISMLGRVPDQDPTTRGAIAIIRLRMSLWQGRSDQVRAQGLRWEEEVDPARFRLLELLGSVYLGRVGAGELERALQDAMTRNSSPRFASRIYQLATEVLAARGEGDAAFAYLEQAARDLMVDVDWLTHCPVLGDLRLQRGFDALLERVRQRAAAIWAT